MLTIDLTTILLTQTSII